MPELFYFISKKLLTFLLTCCIINSVRNEYVSVAQLDRASDYGSEGRVFESCHSHQKRISDDIRFFLFHRNFISRRHTDCGISFAHNLIMQTLKKGGISAAHFIVGKNSDCSKG